MTDTPITTVIAGLGRAGWYIHWRQLLKGHPAYRVVGAIEPVAARRAEAEAEIGCRTYASFEAFLREPMGELIVLATPSGGHGPEALACLDRGLHVVVDKPMCQGVAEADAMIALSRDRHRVLTCYHPYRFDAAFKVIRDDNDDVLPWVEELIAVPHELGWVEFYDNLAAVIRDGAPLAITPESVRETIAVLETCRRQNPQIWEGI